MHVRILISLGLVLLAMGCARGLDDRDAATRVATPAYPENGPRVLVDEGHHNAHTTSHGYRAFAKLLENDGYRVASSGGRFEREALRSADVLVVVCASGDNPTNDEPAFDDHEAREVSDWVKEGALLLVVDHFPYGIAARPLAKQFDVDLWNGSVEDSTTCDPAAGSTGTLVFSRENGLLGDHPAIAGRGADERVNRVVTFDGTSLGVPPGSVPLLTLSPAAYHLEPSLQIERSGGDTRVTITYVRPTPAAGRVQGIALAWGVGRVVILGEAAMLTAQVKNGRRWGFDDDGVDNRRFALNIMHWLTRLI